MNHIGELLPVPGWARPYLSENPAEKTWTCQQCGIIAPMPFSNGYYARRRCACEQRAREAQEIAAFKQASLSAQAEQTYSWLGRQWMDTGLPEKTFASFRRERQAEAFDEAMQFAQEPCGVLALFGSYGTGKTHLLAAIANTLRLEGKPCLFASAVTLFEAIQDRIQQEQDYHTLLKRAVNTPVLILDDLDKLKPSEFREATLYHLIDKRTSAGRALALSSNCTPYALERFVGEAARSRLMMGLVPVQMTGRDYRVSQGKEAITKAMSNGKAERRQAVNNT